MYDGKPMTPIGRIDEIEKLTRGPLYQNLGYDEKIQEFCKYFENL